MDKSGASYENYCDQVCSLQSSVLVNSDIGLQVCIASSIANCDESRWQTELLCFTHEISLIQLAYILQYCSQLHPSIIPVSLNREIKVPELVELLSSHAEFQHSYLT